MSDRYIRHVMFSIGDMVFEYDEEKNQKNIKKHGLPLSLGARVFLMTIELNWMIQYILMKSSVLM